MKRKTPDSLSAPELMLIALKNEADEQLAALREPGCGVDAWDLAARVGLINSDTVNEHRLLQVRGAQFAVPEYGRLLVGMGWAEEADENLLSPPLVPTMKGLEHARYLSRPWYQKAWEYLSGDIRAVAAAVIASVVTTWVLNVIG